MKKIIFILLYSVVAFFLIGFFAHTSIEPQILNKYTLKYFSFSLGISLVCSFLVWLIYYLATHSRIKIKKKKYNFTGIQKTSLFIFIVLLVIAPVEVYLRNKYSAYESNSYQYTINNYHPFLQFQLTDSYTTNINSFGFRGEEIKKEKPQGTYRIFVLGGSTVLNKVIPFEKTAPRILEKRLREQFPHKKIEVINAGVDGYTTEHSLIEYMFKIKDFNPDLIVMWHGINDWYYSCSPEERSYTSYKPDYSHFLNAHASMTYNYFKPQPLVSIKVVSIDFFREFLELNWYSDIRSFIKRTNPDPSIYSAKNESMTYEMKNFASLPSYKRNIINFIHATKSDNVKLILGNQPFLYSKNLTEKELTSIFFPKLQCTDKQGKYPDLNSMINAMNTYNKSVEDISKKEQIPFINLESKLPKTSEYFTDDVHYTEEGNSKVADTLYNFIITNHIIE